MSNFSISMLDMVSTLSNVLDMVSPALAGHHSRVANIAYSLAKQLCLDKKDRNDLFLAALLHDCGALSLQERLDALQFELDDVQKHSEAGYLLLKSFKPFDMIAKIIRYHHISWNNGEGAVFQGERIPITSHILHLADRIDVILDRDKNVLGQSEKINKKISEGSGKKFVPEFVSAFQKLSQKESFWLDIIYLSQHTCDKQKFECLELDFESMLGITRVYEKIIDFRSRFTATHSSGVAAVAEEIARSMGVPEDVCTKLRVAGYLHDLGKLAIPSEVLEKAGKLTDEEFALIRSHTYHSYRVLSGINEFDDIKMYACFHHECLNGTGYPFHLSGDQLPLGSRILAVADIFTAITEDRPYRKGMESHKVLGILKAKADKGEIDSTVVSALQREYNTINRTRILAQHAAACEYEEFIKLKVV